MTMDILERPMAQKKNNLTVANGGPVRQYPPAAYGYDDDVTPEGIALVRERFGVDLSKLKVRQIDGFGCLVPVRS
jgi:hypothetical protein